MGTRFNKYQNFKFLWVWPQLLTGSSLILMRHRDRKRRSLRWLWGRFSRLVVSLESWESKYKAYRALGGYLSNSNTVIILTLMDGQSLRTRHQIKKGGSYPHNNPIINPHLVCIRIWQSSHLRFLIRISHIYPLL